MTKLALHLAAAALRKSLMTELDGKSRTTTQLATLAGVEPAAAYRALLVLQAQGKVTSFRDRRKVVTDSPALVWSRPDAPRVVEKARRDPLVAAFFGTAP